MKASQSLSIALSVLAVAFVTMQSSWVTAQTFPETMGYSGSITRDGEPFEGRVTVRFSLHDAESSGDEVWSEQQALDVVAGSLRAELGGVELLDGVFDGAPLWLELTVDGATLEPRTYVGTQPYAWRAQTANDAVTLGGNSVQDIVQQIPAPTSAMVPFDDSGTGLGQTTTQGAIQALVERLERLEGTVDMQRIQLEQAQMELSSVRADVGAQTAGLMALQDKTQDITRTTIGGNAAVVFESVNVHIRSGSGATNGFPMRPAEVSSSMSSVNGLGNLVIGYDESATMTTKSGSHNLVVGYGNSYTSFGGIVAGSRNSIESAYASVTAGAGNTASGLSSSVSGGFGNSATSTGAWVGSGENNTASGLVSSVSGGRDNTASGSYSAVSGGASNTASGLEASVSAGSSNTASASYSSVSGGARNVASGVGSSVSGGFENTASGVNSSSSGGLNNVSDGQSSSIAGGEGNEVTADHGAILGGQGNEVLSSASQGTHAVICGGRGNETRADHSAILGGQNNKVRDDPLSAGNGGQYAVVCGGRENEAQEDWSSITGGRANKTTGTSSSVTGGFSNTASAPVSVVSGGNTNTASGEASVVSGGRNRTSSALYDWRAGSLFQNE